MGLWPRSARQRVEQVTAETSWPSPRMVTAGVLPTRSEFMGMNALWAMQVPAYSKGYRLISGTTAQLPLRALSGATVGLLSQPELDRAPWVTMQRTVGDLVNYGRAYWLIVSLDASSRPRFVKQIDAAGVSEDPNGRDLRGPQGEEWVISQPWTKAVVGQVIVFTGYTDGALILGVDTIATALALEMATRNYADTPAPDQVFVNNTGYKMDDAEIDKAIADYKKARQNGGVAYLEGLELHGSGWDAQQTALVEQRNQSRLAIAGLLNLDPMWVGASVAGASLTYQNRVDARTDLYGLTLTDYILPIEQRVSMPDCAKEPVRMDASEFLRANLDTRATMATGLLAGDVITRDEARDFISDRPTGGPTS